MWLDVRDSYGGRMDVMVTQKHRPEDGTAGPGPGCGAKFGRGPGRTRASALACAIVMAAAALACSEDGPEEISGEEARDLLENRNWLDEWPRSKDDRLRVYRFTPEMGGGVFQDRTLYRGDFELFNYEIGEGRVRFHFPDSGEDVTTAYRIERVAGPEPFDLRLTFGRAPRGPSVYYGMRAEGSAESALWDVPAVAAGSAVGADSEVEADPEIGADSEVGVD